MPTNEEKLVLIRGDGSRIEATPEQAERLSLLGYKQETAGERLASLQSSAEEAYYTSADQRLQAGVEGFASGLTLTGSDYLGDKEGLEKRTQYNPGTRIGSELVGALLPLVLSRGASAEATGAAVAEDLALAARTANEVGEAGRFAKLAKLAPTSLLSSAAETLAPGKTFTSAVMRGAFEGSVYGGLGAADHAYLDDSPLTAETIVHGMGWGALVGAGIGAAGHGISSLGAHEAGITAEVEAKNAAERARYEADVKVAKAAEREAVPSGALKSQAEAPYQALKSEVNALSGGLKDMASKAESSFHETMDALYEGGRFNDLAGFGENQATFAKALRNLEESFDKVSSAVEAGKFQKAVEAQAEYTAHVTDIAKKLGMEPPSAAKALEEYVAAKSVSAELSRLPNSVEGFAKMSPAKLERATAALEKAQNLGLGNVDAIKQASEALNSAMGLDATAGLRDVHAAAKTTLKYEGKPGVPYKEPKAPQTFGRDLKPQHDEANHASLLKSVTGYFLGGKAWAVARAAGAGKVGSYAAFRSVKDAVVHGPSALSAIKAGVLGKIAKAAGEYLPNTGRRVASAAGPGSLAITLYGNKDDSSSDPKVLALNRIKELYQLAPTATDTIYRALQPLATTQPNLATAMHSSALSSFQQLLADAPKGTSVVNKLQNIWKPSDVQAAIFEKQYSVFRDPVGEATQMLETNNFDIIKSQTLKKYAPEIWQQMRVMVLERLSKPEVMEKLSDNDQIHLSILLDLPLHSRMTPGNIASSQQIFLERRNLNTMPASREASSSGSYTSSPASNPNATAAQKTEMH